MNSIIAAMDSKRGIGKDGGIPWYIPEDFKRFKEITMGHPMIMGRRTFESLGRVLPGRAHIVITRNLKNKTKVENLTWASSLEKALHLAQSKQVNEEIFIIGGGEIFKEVIEKGLADRLYLTIITGDFGADTFFPDYSGFKVKKDEKKEEGRYKFKFLELKK